MNFGQAINEKYRHICLGALEKKILAEKKEGIFIYAA